MSLKQLRSDIGMTQSELADKSGLRQATLSSLENGRTKAQTGITTALASAMGCSVEVIREALENSVSTANDLKPNQAESRFNAEQILGNLLWNWQSAQRAMNGHKKQWKEAMMFLDPILKKHPAKLKN